MPIGGERHDGVRKRLCRPRDEGDATRHLHADLPFPDFRTWLPVVGLGAAVFRRRVQLLLVSSRQPRGAAVLGVARGASLVATLQPLDRAAAELDGHDHGMGLLDVASAGRLPADDGANHAGGQPALSVLDSYGTGALDGAVGTGAEYALASSRTPRIKCALYRPKSCGDNDCVGPVVRDV